MAWAVAVTAASGDSVRVHRLEAEVVPGVILHTNEFLRGNNIEVRMMNRSFVAHLKYAFQPPEGSQEAIIYKGVYQGAGLAYHHFNPQLGNPVSAYIFQGATIATLSSRLSLNYEWNLGLTYGWKSYDEKDHPENHVIGSKLTAYIDAEVYLRWMLSRQCDLNLGASFVHYSNGNTTIPNAGLNVAGARASVAWYFNRQATRLKPSIAPPPSERYWQWDLTAWGAWKARAEETDSGSYALPGTYGVAGIQLTPLYHANHWLNVGGSLDTSYDKGVILGLSGRVEFVMPYFTIDFGIGHNLINTGSGGLKGFYEILALKIALTRRAYLHIGYSLYDFHNPNNLMLGVGIHL